MNIELNYSELKYIKYILSVNLVNIQQALDDNMLFYEDDLEQAFGDLEIVNNILDKLDDKKCEHDYEPVALNEELEDENIELWDCICKKCGEHAILNIKGEN